MKTRRTPTHSRRRGTPSQEQPRAQNGRGSQLTIGAYLRYLAPTVSDDSILLWPPDVFAVAAALLQKSGAYLRVVESWPPRKDDWNLDIANVAAAWREAVNLNRPGKIPAKIKRWWRLVIANRGLPLAGLRQSPVAEALIQIVAAADESCKGAGLPSASGSFDHFDYRAAATIIISHTLCSERIDVSRAVVLPKLHTPQTGITLRSLTHYLALYCPGEVSARWSWLPFRRPEKEIDWNFRLLLLPWPTSLDTRAFRPSKGKLANMPRQYGFFRCDGDHAALDVEHVKRVFDAATARAGHIDGIVFPELALAPHEPRLVTEATGAFVVAGCGTPPHDTECGTNYASISAEAGVSALHQAKHHRWRLEERQIMQYDLGERLDPTRQWWEHIEVGRRDLNFVALADWLVLSFLICEDLARLDPVNQLLHSVGPSLIIALLMDGPQLSSRWAARYATVLADDPGSSVLTLTSLGMCTASRISQDIPPSRVVALWKDALSGPQEIKLEEGSEGIVLSLRRQYNEEWSADGRTDAGATAYLRLHKPLQVRSTSQ